MSGQAASRMWFCFDIGEVLVDETRVWSTWASVLGVSPFTVMAALGAAVDRGEDHTAALPRLGFPDWQDREAEVQEAFGGLRAEDLYPDVLRALRRFREAGYGIAVIGNQPACRRPELAALGVDADVLVMSDELGVHKPDPAFFDAVVDRLGTAAGDIAYVGDRVDNDVVPAAAAGMRAVWLRRGPWGRLHADTDRPASLVVSDLGELVARAGEVWDN